jgi:hypothetical protein
MREVVRWHLELGGQLVARIDADEYDFPWTYGLLVDSPEFERFRRYFTDDTGWPDDDPELDALLGEVRDRGGFVFREVPTGVVYRNVMLNHDGGSVVWFRRGGPA